MISAHRLNRSLQQSELDYEADSMAIEKAGVPCPVEWCEAHVIRYGPCGDTKGDFYGGIHHGRVTASKRNTSRAKRKVAALKRLGFEEPEVVVGLVQMCEDSVNLGLGKPGDETIMQKRQKRARKLAGMTK